MTAETNKTAEKMKSVKACWGKTGRGRSCGRSDQASARLIADSRPSRPCSTS
jgi:hypothetical protein